MTTSNTPTDIIIIGSGAAGLSAALEARRAGASVLVTEKMKVIGGNTRISDGVLSVPGNHLQRKAGIADSPARFYDDMMRAGLGLNHPNLLRTVADQALDALEWTRHTLGVPYLDRLDRLGGHSVARSLTIPNNAGVALLKALRDKLEQAGGVIRTRCRLTGLVTGSDGGVEGAAVRSGWDDRNPDSGVPETLYAGRAVILATGGFGNDPAFRVWHDPSLDAGVRSTNHRGATAEGLISALRVQAMPVHLSRIQTGPWACAEETGYGIGARFASYSIFPAGIVVDPATGRRIVNEWSDRKQRADAIIQRGHPCIGIVDAAGAQKDRSSLAHCLKTGKTAAFDDPAALAGAYGIPPDALADTIREYNHRITQGEPDPFGKPLCAGVGPITRPPFYAIRLWPKAHYTPGGVGITEKAEVIDLSGRPIPRLYAAGEVGGGIHGASRLGGCALPECLVFGRIAGRQAAGERKREPAPSEP